jgi:NAD(P)-dependent dehydrogenase (short-subunit alcohol dehydrogenase family)
MLLKDKVAIVTGSSNPGGIGFATAALYARNGAKVVIADLKQDACDAAAAEIKAKGGQAMAIQADVAEETAVQAMVDRTVAAFGSIDVLVNNAGVSINALFVDTELADWKKVIDIDLTGAFLCGQRVARVMVKQGSGRIINICSLSGQRGGVGRAAYGSAKAGLELLTKVMAVELAEHGLNVNGIAPGPVETALTKVVHTPATRESYIKMIPQHRYGTTDEIANGALFLASDMANYVNGHILNIDGGMLTAGVIYKFDQPTAKSF